MDSMRILSFLSFRYQIISEQLLIWFVAISLHCIHYFKSRIMVTLRYSVKIKTNYPMILFDVFIEMSFSLLFSTSLRYYHLMNNFEIIIIEIINIWTMMTLFLYFLIKMKSNYPKSLLVVFTKFSLLSSLSLLILDNE